MSQQTTTESPWRTAAGWFGGVYLLAALAGLALSSQGARAPFGLPLDGVRGAAVGAVGMVAVVGSRGRQAMKTGLLVGVAGGLGTLALIGLVRGG